MVEIESKVTGDRELTTVIRNAPGEVEGALFRSIGRTVLKITTLTKLNLSGVVLKVRTGRLRRSIVHRVSQSGNVITGIVGTNVEYAARHEMGVTGSEPVKAHLREIKKAWGKALPAPMKVSVRAHTRSVNYPPRSFLGSALAAAIETGSPAKELADELRKLRVFRDGGAS